MIAAKIVDRFLSFLAKRASDFRHEEQICCMREKSAREQNPNSANVQAEGLYRMNMISHYARRSTLIGSLAEFSLFHES
jgi:hypothetical protein